MSLRVWLPLNGDLHNQGLSNISVTNSGATVNTSGKIGSCYSFGTSASGMNITNYDFSQFTECSVSVWLKIISWNTNYATYVQLGTNGRSWANYIFGVLRGASASKLAFVIGNTSSTTTTNCLTSELELNTWYHFAFVYKNGNMKIYKNGALDTEYTTSIVPAFSSISKISLGRANDNGYQSNCLMNDFRIYDHALSELEIKEIARAKVLHYPLNHNGFGMPNLLKLGSVQQSGNSQTAHILYWYFDFSENLPTGTYTLSFDAKTSNGTDNAYVSYANGSSTIVRISNLITIPSNWKHYTFTFTNTASNCNNIFFTSYKSYGGSTSPNKNNTGYLYVRNVKLENGNKATPFALAASEDTSIIEYDISGYCNNGTKVGTFTYSTDTPKYGSSTIFNGSSSIKFLDFNLGNIWSAGIWFYSPSTSAKTWSSLFTVNNNGGDSDLKMNIYYQQTSKSLQYSANGQYQSGIGYPNKDKWHQVFEVFDGTNLYCYLDGSLIRTKSITNSEYTRKNLVIGARSSAIDGSTTIAHFEGKLSDFRIYATALSARDILSLYHNSALVDEQGIIHGAIH